jgi:hypothetical protein
MAPPVASSDCGPRNRRSGVGRLGAAQTSPPAHSYAIVVTEPHGRLQRTSRAACIAYTLRGRALAAENALETVAA